MPAAVRLRGGWRAAATAVLLAAALFAGGCSKSVPELLADAKAYRAKGDVTAAVVALKDALDQDPGNVEAEELIGASYAEIGALLDAEKELRKALEAGASPDRNLPVLGRVLVEAEKYKDALQTLTISTQKLSPQALAELTLLRGRAYLGLGNAAEAKTQFFLAGRDRPVDAKVGLARVAASQGDSKTAYQLVDEALTLAPNSAEAWLAKGDFLRSESKTDEALAAFQRAAKLQPGMPLAHLSEALLLIAGGKFDAARAKIEIARKLAPASPNLYFTIALLAFRERNFDLCGESLQYVFQVIPRHMPSILLSGALFFSTAQLEQAQTAFVTYISAFPGNVYARKMLAATLLRKAQPQSATEALEPLLRFGLRDAELYSLAGQAYLQVGQVRRAREYLEKAVALDPGNANARTRLGLTRFAGGDRKGAVADLESAMALEPGSMQTENYLAMALIAQNELDKALEVATLIESKRSSEPETHVLKGAVYLARQDYANARASYERALKLKPSYFPAAAALANLDLRDNNSKAARARMEEVLKNDKGNLDAMLMLARLELDAGRIPEARDWVQRAVSEHPEALQAYLLLAQVQMQSGEVKDAMTVARQARDMSPKDPRAVEVLARAQMASGDKTGAIISYTTLAGMLPRSIPAKLDLARAYIANGEYRQAAEVIKQALTIEPNNIDVRTTLGAIYLQTNRLSDALDVAMQLQKQAPQVPQGYALEGDVAMAQQQYVRAAAAYEKADRLVPGGLVRVRIHEAQSKARKGPVSDAPLLEWLKQHPNDVDVRFYLADVYLRSDKYPAAIEQYQALLKENPKDFRVLNNMSWAMMQAGDPRAADYAQQAFQQRPDDPIVADTLGWTLVNQGKIYEGLQVMFKAVALGPDNPEIRYHLAQALVKAGDKVRARSELKIVLASKRPFAQAEEARELLKTLSP